jgi:hypothetical protein
MTFSRMRFGALVASVALSACGRIEPDQGCQQDKECGAGNACVVGACVPRISGPSQTWSLEMAPKTESSWALTEVAMVTFTSTPIQLKVEGKARIEGQITDLDPSPVNPTMRVLVSLPSALGKGERQFEAEATRVDDKTKLHFVIFLPESAVGLGAKLSFLPASPLDQLLPVWTVTLATLGPTVIVPAPKSNDLWVVEGVLQDELEQPPSVPYVARAMLGDRLVSTVARTDAQGRFKVKIPNAPSNAISLDQVRVDLAPADPAAVEPHLSVNVSAAKPNLGVLRLPARPKPQVLDIPVAALGTAAKKLPGVTLRFSAQLEGAFGGKATVAREFQTDRDGIAHVTLLPGLAGQTREYTVAVVPPPSSEFAARCFSGYLVAAVPSGQARVGASIELGNKLEVTGRITDGTGTIQPGVILTAIRQRAVSPQDCGNDAVSVQSTFTSGSDGSYRMLLDPGSYRLEYEPPQGSAATFFVEPDVLVEKSLSQRVVQMPSGVVATGVVTSSTGDAVLGCELRVFGIARDGQLPELRARTRTTTDGRFSIVLPRGP